MFIKLKMFCIMFVGRNMIYKVWVGSVYLIEWWIIDNNLREKKED